MDCSHYVLLNTSMCHLSIILQINVPLFTLLERKSSLHGVHAMSSEQDPLTLGRIPSISDDNLFAEWLKSKNCFSPLFFKYWHNFFIVTHMSSVFHGPMGPIFLMWIGPTVGLGMYRTWLGRSHVPGRVDSWIIHGRSDLPLGKGSIQGYGIVLDMGPMGPIFLVLIG